MIELFGDSSRGGDWAAVRLWVDGQRIARADAPGLDRDLVGLTLYEAAAVGGDTLATDALANAIGPAVRASADPDRVAVAMSGGVDSAVALLKAGGSAIGVTLRLWIDPRASDAERACCSPSAVIAARELCHARGLPHVTLDLRDEFRQVVVDPFVRAYARGETPNPCIRCNGSFRFTELLAFATRIGAARLATGHYARLVERNGRQLLARAVDETKDQSYMLARLDERSLARLWFPLGDQTKEETAPRPQPPGWRSRAARTARRRASSAATTTASFSAATGLHPRPATSSTGQASRLARTTASGTSRPASGVGLGSRPPSRCTRSSRARQRTPSSSARGRRSRGHTFSARGHVHAGATRVEAKLRYRSPAVPATVEPTARGFRLILDEPAYGVARGQVAVLYVEDAIVGSGLITSTAAN